MQAEQLATVRGGEKEKKSPPGRRRGLRPWVCASVRPSVTRWTPARLERRRLKSSRTLVIFFHLLVRSPRGLYKVLRRLVRFSAIADDDNDNDDGALFQWSNDLLSSVRRRRRTPARPASDRPVNCAFSHEYPPSCVRWPCIFITYNTRTVKHVHVCTFVFLPVIFFPFMIFITSLRQFRNYHMVTPETLGAGL